MVNIKKLIQRLPPYTPGLIILTLWGGILIASGFLRFDNYGIDEIAARALLFNWSAMDEIANPILALGIPDFRALFFLPLGLYWPGSMVAAKVFTLLISAYAIYLIFLWLKTAFNNEIALIACGMLLISPALIMQINTMGTGPFLLFMFCIGALIDRRYRSSARVFNASYFFQALAIMLTVSLHPAGLAYPLAIIWQRWKNPIDEQNAKAVYIGVACATILALLLQMGWNEMSWGSNPALSMGASLIGPISDETGTHQVLGLILCTLLTLVLFKQARILLKTTLGTMLFFATLTGVVAANTAWAMIAFSILLFMGIPLLIHTFQRKNKQGFFAQRGIAFILIFIVINLAMQGDKAIHQMSKQLYLSPIDNIINELELETATADKNQLILVASQWPGKTMLATRRTTFPLPPEKDIAEHLENMVTRRGMITHLVFDHRAPVNRYLINEISKMSANMETLTVHQNGVLVKVRKNIPARTDPG